MTSQPDFNPSCPSGGSWYACGNGTQFAGCCGEYPCTDTGCSAGLLYAASFDASKYGSFSDQRCSSGQFYTCDYSWQTDPPATPFIGCCEIDPCSSTTSCPTDSLAAMFLSANTNEANQFDPQPPLAGASSSQSSSSSTVSSTLAPSSSSKSASTTTGSAAAASTTAVSKEDDHSTPLGAIIGGAVGGFALICAIIFIVWRVKYHSKRSSKKHREESGLHNRLAQNQNNANESNGQQKMAVAGVVPMHSPYQDSPSTVPPYSPQHPSQNWSPQSNQGYNEHFHQQQAANHSAFRAYSPQAGNYSPYGHPSQFSPPIARTTDHAHSNSWDGNSAPDPSVSQYIGPQFARVHQGPPQEMSGNQDQSWAGLGVQYVSGSHVDRPRAELGES